MSLISEKTILPSKLISCLIAFSILLLISSSLSILEFNDNSLISKSFLQFITVNNNTSTYPIPIAVADTQNSPVISPLLPNQTSEKQNIRVNDVTSQARYPKTTIEEPEKHRNIQCDKSRALLRVYMYDLPPEFHFWLLGWNGSTNQTWPNVSDLKSIPSYPGGLNIQHSTEYWLTLDLLASNTQNVIRPCSAIRVMDPSEANLIFVPFFSSLSYNRHSKRHDKEKASGDRILQEKLLAFLKGRKEWKKSGGKDHLIVAHHPNSMLIARKKLGSCMFVLSDFGRYTARIANLKKDVIAPYKHMVRTIPGDESASFDERPTLVYFQGAIYRKDGGVIRQELFYLLSVEKDVHFTFGSAQSSSVKEAGKGMASSKFCLNIAGDTPSSNRLFDAIAAHCVPVIISDEIELPFEDALDYSEFCVFVRAADAVRKGYLMKLLRGVSREKWTEMWGKLKSISGHFEYQYPSIPNDAVDMIWQTVARKKTSRAQLSVHRKNRYSRSQFLR
ncbi:probable arabinosyltransferase arad1 [Phtheirospermum japonicum]|uniref:Probable arabinosyltransferase arad1 n=1 Tax=Phtheirospermum japonicum TaxID=374723 RepID=A0A830CI39_9LAMI|nr:probable arabinosyltransferase arad1 [Phtheirospermum japonicum]